jgi:hypothetical protein
MGGKGGGGSRGGEMTQTLYAHMNNKTIKKKEKNDYKKKDNGGLRPVRPHLNRKTWMRWYAPVIPAIVENVNRRIMV